MSKLLQLHQTYYKQMAQIQLVSLYIVKNEHNYTNFLKLQRRDSKNKYKPKLTNNHKSQLNTITYYSNSSFSSIILGTVKKYFINV